MSDQPTRDAMYTAYSDWKGWDKSAPPGPSLIDMAIYEQEMARASIPVGSQILELGFGGGTFLDWARSAGYATYGVETLDDMVRSAATRGHRVLLGELHNVKDRLPSDFDAVVAFDVLEHLDHDQLLHTLRTVAALLRPGGKLLARIPNGLSPFGRYYQYGDLTHRSVLHYRSLQQLGLPLGLRLAWYNNAARPYEKGFPAWFRSKLKGLVERIVGWLYFNGHPLPLDPNMTVVLVCERHE